MSIIVFSGLKKVITITITIIKTTTTMMMVSILYSTRVYHTMCSATKQVSLPKRTNAGSTTLAAAVIIMSLETHLT